MDTRARRQFGHNAFAFGVSELAPAVDLVKRAPTAFAELVAAIEDTNSNAGTFHHWMECVDLAAT
jgi:hypothetical protein